MKKLNTSGYLISSVDKKALEHYLLVTPQKWASDGLRGMVNKAIKTIIKDHIEKFKEIQVDSIPANKVAIIEGIIAMEEFIPYNRKTPVYFDRPVSNKFAKEQKEIERKELVSEEIWPNGFEVEDYEYLALLAFYDDPEAQLEWFMTNKIYQRREAITRENLNVLINDPEITEIPKHQDDVINLICSRPGYKNRAEREDEEAI